MLQSRSICAVADNSGVKQIRVIQPSRRGPKKPARVGDIVVASAILVTPLSQIKKKTVVKAIVVRTTSPIRRSDGSSIKFSQNAVVIVADEGIKGTRIIGPIPREIRNTKYKKIISLAKEVI
ncbi:MAG: 50S ribosomal protein L14 [Candidatus Berkelbacteria bacterium Licking1014_7]|uniref:Large ribosomal subunit protein uL14 n=1 Tax=Candidatus Berkelbacteria bacterium Licking1014_7 TaxID=2017147 RepID=A0A554LKL3_9BACT|nr:MAG: 50S ribosomal protein L14 [Candidatus Berkelbacteria bacterium Licking1014_7]